MNASYTLINRRNRGFYAQHAATGKQKSLRTKDRSEAQRLLLALNEAERDSRIAREVGMAYLKCADPEAGKRTWAIVINHIVALKTGDTQYRWRTAAKDSSFGRILDLLVIDTQAEDFLAVLIKGTVSTNVYLRRIHNFALDMGWLARPVINRRQWPAVRHAKRRAITLEEHERILDAEVNPERRDFYRLLWLTGAAQGDLAILNAESIDWRRMEIRFFRKKTNTVTCQKFGALTEEVLRRLPSKGLLFPYLATVRSGDRSTEFGQRCKQLAINGVTLHCYRHAWAKRAKLAGFPERYAQLALGHNSRAIHEHYAGVDEASIPALEDYEAKESVRSKPNDPPPIRMIIGSDGRWN